MKFLICSLLFMLASQAEAGCRFGRSRQASGGCQSGSCGQSQPFANGNPTYVPTQAQWYYAPAAGYYLQPTPSVGRAEVRPFVGSGCPGGSCPAR